MGILIDGVWKDQWYDTSTGGRFVAGNRAIIIGSHQMARPDWQAKASRRAAAIISTCRMRVRGRTAP
jgi:hypothetical protein